MTIQMKDSRLKDHTQASRGREAPRLAQPPAAVPLRSAAEDTNWLAGAELRAMQATTDAVLAHATDLVLFFDADGTVVWASPASERLFGLPPDQLVGQSGFALVHPGDRDRVLVDFMGIPSLGDSVRTEFRVMDKDQSIRWVEEVATNLLDDPDVGAVVGHIRDITDRKAAEAEVRFQARLLAAAGQAMVAQDAGGMVLYWNRAAEDLYGWTSDEALGRLTRDLLAPAPEWAEPAPGAQLLFEEGAAWSGELFITTRSGSVVPVSMTGTPVPASTGEPAATIIVSSDISERIARRDQAEQDRQRLADAQASAGLGSFEMDLVTGEVTRSDELWRILGHDSDTAQLGLFDAVHPDDRPAIDAAVDLLRTDGEEVAVTHRIVRPDGEIRWVVSKARGSRRGPHRFAGTILDITERHLAELALDHQARHDPLTGLANRRLLVERIEASLQRNRTTDRRTAVLFVDLDDFTAVNDRIGHAGGDTILRAVGDAIEGVLTPGDTVARIGGDEFVVCCEGVADIETALEVSERIRGALAAPFRFHSESLRVAASIGITISHPSSHADGLLRDADAAMYVAKQNRRQVEVFDDEMSEQTSRRRQAVTELEAALTAGQIHTWFQPEVELLTGELIGFEALVRWHHPERGVISPAEFIGLAEDSGLIIQLGRQVLDDACRELARWIDRHPDRHLTVSVNLSPIQMVSCGLAESVGAAIANAGVPAGRVCLEVTETALMDAEVAAEVLRKLKEIGVLIAIDDFGTGYSSLSRIKDFPVDFLKIDRSFVAGLGRNPDDELIVTAVTNLAHSMGIQVIAEGIETGKQLSLLAGMGCEFGQGFLWSRPMPPAEALAFAASPGMQRSVDLLATEARDQQARSLPQVAESDAASASVALLVHELASPLTVSLGHASLLRETGDLALHAEVGESLEAIVKANNDMASIMRCLADIRPLEDGTLALDRHPIDIPSLVADLLSEMGTAGQTTLELIGGDTSSYVLGDPTRIRQIFRNLLTNAQKWQATSSWVEVTRDDARCLVTVAVFDDGPGVPAEQTGDLFRRFARFDRSRTGTGLGLYLSRALARVHGGDIRYHRTEQGGSEFAVELPLVQVP